MPELKTCPKRITKKNHSEEECRMKFLEHDNTHHHNHVQLYTDGSKSSIGVGCAVSVDGIVHQRRISSSATVFSGINCHY